VALVRIRLKIVLKTIQLCIIWWKNFDNYQDTWYVRGNSYVCRYDWQLL